MTWLPDAAVGRLRDAVDLPDLTGTRYKLIEKLGQGGMGSVYRVEDTALGRHVALKVIVAAHADDELAGRLLREAQIIARLEHPGIVPVHDVGTLPDGRVFYTMKLVQGQRLDRHVAQFGNLRDWLRVFEKICEAVWFAHTHGVLHRDLKPQNIMVGPFGEVLVLDWGLSKVLGERPATGAQPVATDWPAVSTETASGAVLGTPGYMAPEQKRGQLPDQRTDVYSLGVILEFLFRLAERPPRAVAAISRKAMAEDATQRYASVKELAEDVAHYLDGLAVAAYPEPFYSRAWHWVVKHRAWILLILAYLVMRTAFILWRGR
jgi:serine/threonine protein kinase